MQAVKKALGMKVPSTPKKVIYFPITKVNAEETEKLKDKLKTLKKSQKVADAILLGINIGPATDPKNCSITQTDLMGKMFREKAKELEVPLVTYAEEMALFNGMHLLMQGDHVLASEVSILGNIGQRMTPYYAKDFLEDWHVRMRYVHHGENKVRFNPF